MTKKSIVQMLKDSGIEFVDASHPIYTRGPFILFANRVAPPPEPVEDAPTDEEEDSNG